MFSFHSSHAFDPLLPEEGVRLEDEQQHHAQTITYLEQTLGPLQEEIERRKDWLRILTKTHERRDRPEQQAGLLHVIQQHQQELHALEAERSQVAGALHKNKRRQTELDSLFSDGVPIKMAKSAFPPDFLRAKTGFFNELLNPYRHNLLLNDEWLRQATLRKEILSLLEHETPNFVVVQEQLRQESEDRYPLWPEEERHSYLRLALPHHIHQITQDIHQTAQAVEAHATTEDAFLPEQFAAVYEQAAQLLLRSLHRPTPHIPHEMLCAILTEHSRYDAPAKTRDTLVDAVHAWVDQAIRTHSIRSGQALHAKRRYQQFTIR